MHKTLFNKFKSFGMLSAFVILFSSCDKSTSANEENSALKKEIAGEWELYRTCIEQNIIKEYTGDYYDIGDKDTLAVYITKLLSTDNVIKLNNGYFDIVGEWIKSETFNFPHWVMKYEVVDRRTNLSFESTIEITEIYPLKGIYTEKMSDSTFTGLKLLRKYEITGIKNQIVTFN